MFLLHHESLLLVPMPCLITSKAPRLIPVIINPAIPPEIAELALNASEKIRSKEE
ncbi:MAG: hypothetical protein CM15mP12_1100 [Gammaproteobacteria bacterium]|nr:MAG: hypothetical protein CM15mP12_1100 [Gammaproteobacteria bacterium]